MKFTMLIFNIAYLIILGFCFKFFALPRIISYRKRMPLPSLSDADPIIFYENFVSGNCPTETILGYMRPLLTITVTHNVLRTGALFPFLFTLNLYDSGLIRHIEKADILSIRERPRFLFGTKFEIIFLLPDGSECTLVLAPRNPELFVAAMKPVEVLTA